jgi:DNA gyrase inhibitor GyrI
MKLKQKPEIVIWPEIHYLCIEKIGPFQETAPVAWQRLHQLVPVILHHNKITGYMSLYKVDPKKMTYRAGVAVPAKPKQLPEDLAYTKFPGGKYVCFVLTGSYTNLPAATSQVFEIITENKIPRRDDYCIEHYLNDPRSTPEEELITEILIPTL